MKFYDECRECLLRSQSAKIRRERTPDETAAFLKGVDGICAAAPDRYCAPLLVRDMDGLYREMFGTGIDYSREKALFNSAMLGTEDGIETAVNASPDPLTEAIRFSMAANYIDFARLTEFSPEAVIAVSEAAGKARPDPGTTDMLRHDLALSSEICFLHDNCGEIVADKILIKTIKRMYPGVAVTSVVRGGPIINDATPEDAGMCRLGDVSHVIPSGAAVPGTDMSLVSAEVRDTMDRADVIISKGLGNLETLADEKYGVYHMFMCKCRHIAERFSVSVGDTVLCFCGGGKERKG